MREDGSRRRVVPEAANGSLWLTAMWTGVGAAVVCATLGIVAVAICWLPVAGASAHTMSALHAGLLTFLAALHGGVTVDGTSGAFLPLGLLLVVAFTAWRAGAALGDTAGDLDERDPAQLGKALLVQTSTFTLAALIAIPFAHLGTSSAPVLGVFAGAFVLFGLSAGAGLVRASELREWLRARTPDVVARGARAAAAALAVYLGVGALLVAGSLAVHHARVEELSRQVGGGWGSVPILVLGMLAAPNAAIAGASYLAGPGFAIGTGSHVGPVGATHGLVPAFPVLGALPAGGANPVVWVLVAGTPLLAGGVVARLCLRGATWRDRFAELGVTVVAVALLMAVLAWQGGGSLGPGRLATVGASPLLAAGMVSGEVAVAGAACLGAAFGWARWHGSLSGRGWNGRRARPAVRPVMDVELPDSEPSDSDLLGVEAADADGPDGQVTERIDAPAPHLVVVQEPGTDDGDEAGKLAG